MWIAVIHNIEGALVNIGGMCMCEFSILFHSLNSTWCSFPQIELCRCKCGICLIFKLSLICELHWNKFAFHNKHDTTFLLSKSIQHNTLILAHTFCLYSDYLYLLFPQLCGNSLRAKVVSDRALISTVPSRVT